MSLILEEIILPATTTVHLGRPIASAQNVTIGFVDYIKNVASSEIYPTWPYEALRANIWCQMSLALNCIYTEWYRSRGYSLDITNSVALDQALVPGRNIYGNIVTVMDEVTGDYPRKPFHRESYCVEYCDGKRAQCPGLKQWGTLGLANRGYDFYGIIRYYYDDQMQFLETDNWQPYTPSYPGYALRLGSSNQSVFTIQELLNGITVNYPNIPLIYPPDAVLGPQTESAVRAFQWQFDLIVDGIVGQSTWYQISRIYVAVRKLTELGSSGKLEGYFTGLQTGKVLRQGDVDTEVQQLQYFLSTISESYPSIPSVTVDSRFEPGLDRAVRAYQREFGLAVDGLIGRCIWNSIYGTYAAIVG